MAPRILAAIGLVALASLLATGRLLLQVSEVYSSAPNPDGVTEFTGRFADLRNMLPKRGVVGYLSSGPVAAGDTNALAEFYLAQYAMAPVIVVNSPEQKYVIGNFHEPISTGKLRDAGFKLVREFGNGIALLENERVR